MTLEDVSIPGVGLWTPGVAKLEGSPDRVPNCKFKHSVNHLILNIHDPSQVRECLREFHDIKVLELNYFDGCAFPGVNWGLQLATCRPEKVYIRGTDKPMKPWQYLCLWDTCRCLYRASVNDIPPPEGLQAGVVVSTEWDEWYRVLPCGKVIAPAFYSHLVPKEIERVVLDFEESMRPIYLSDSVRELTMWSVPPRWNDILKMVGSLKLRKLVLSGESLVVSSTQENALLARVPKVEVWR